MLMIALMAGVMGTARVCTVVRLGATHDPKRNMPFDSVVAVAPLYYEFRAGVVAVTWRAMPNDHDVGHPLLQLPPPPKNDNFRPQDRLCRF
jgi:hypothetical protein